MTQILVVEDDKKLGQLIREFLTNHNFNVSLEMRGDKAAYRILHENYDLVILDLMLPGLDGLQLCKVVRKNYPGLILMLTAREGDEDHITGLNFGADDFINKPISPDVLLARIKLLLKRKKTQFKVSTVLNFGKLKIDLEKREVSLDNKKIDFKPGEFDLLALLALNAGTSMSRNNIMLATRGIEYDGVDRTIDLRISYIRTKLNDDPLKPFRIKTLRGKGYVFLPDAWD